MMTYLFNPGTWEAEEEHGEFKVNRGYIMRPCPKKKEKREK